MPSYKTVPKQLRKSTINMQLYSSYVPLIKTAPSETNCIV